MKKRLVSGILLSSALLLGACSGEETKEVKADKVEQIKQDDNVLVYEVDGNKQKEEVRSMDASADITAYLPAGFTEHSADGSTSFQAIGTGEYEDFLFTVLPDERMVSTLDRQIYKFEKMESSFGGQGTEVIQLDLEEFPDLKKKYDYVAKIKVGIGGMKYVAMKQNNGKAIFVIMRIKNEEKAVSYENFAFEVLEKVELSAS